MRFVPVKTEAQQVVLSLHRIRVQLMKSRIMQTNELRGILYEFGIVLPEGHRQLLLALPDTLKFVQLLGVSSKPGRFKPFTARAYLTLQARRRDWQARVLNRLQGFDAWLMPTVPVVAPRLAELEADEALYFSTNALVLPNPSIVNFMDGCALSLPCHAADEAPVGLSLAAPALADEALLDWAQAMAPFLQPAA